MLTIPEIFNISNIDQNLLEQFKRIGICYIKIPSESTTDSLNRIKDTANNFFTSEDKHKPQYSLNPNDKTPKLIANGYLDRRPLGSKLETFRHRLENELPRFLINNSKDVEEIKKNIVSTIILTLFFSIIDSLEFNSLGKVKAAEMVKGVNPSLQFTYYEKRTFFERLSQIPGFQPHKDTSFLTLIHFDEPGLKIWNNGSWHEVIPKKGYLVALIGSLAVSMSEGRLCAPVHTVAGMSKERLSVVVFFSGNSSAEIFSRTGNRLASTLMEHAIHIEEKQAACKEGSIVYFNRLHFQINLYATVFLGLVLSFLIKNLMKGRLDTSSKISSVFSGVFLSYVFTNACLYIFKHTYFNRMSMDYLQHPEMPIYASEKEKNAYKLGEMSTTFFGMLTSCADQSSYKHRSYWNAGVMKSNIEACSSHQLKK